MATSKTLANSYTSIPNGCLHCGGKCFDKDQSTRHANFRKSFPDLPLPDKCVDTCNGLTVCPAASGAI